MTAIPCTWQDDCFRPARSQLQLARRRFVTGHGYYIEVAHERSKISHDHFFATVDEAYHQLPENLAAQFKSSEHFRKHCLIKANFCREIKQVVESEKEAYRAAELAAKLDEYAIVKIEGNILRIWIAESQSKQAMGGKRFQQSKQAVIDLMAEMIGVSPEELSSNAGRAA